MRNWKEWIKAAAIRAIRTFAQAAIAQIAVGSGFVDVDWATVLSVSGVAALLSVLTSLAGLPEVPQETPEESAWTEEENEDAEDI